MWSRPAFYLVKVLFFRRGSKEEVASLLELAKAADLGIELEAGIGQKAPLLVCDC